MAVRETVNVCSTTLTYKGLIDIGDLKDQDNNFLKANNIKDMANIAFIFMFQPLCDNYTQPVAVFTSRCPVYGTVLA